MGEPLLKEIPAQKFGEQFKAIREELLDRIERVCSHGQFILGPEVRTFEADFARWLGAQQAVGCNSGSDALFLSLIALRVGAGDEVITTPSTYFATGGAIVRTGARPVFVDIDPQTYNMDVEKIEERITKKTKVILPVHLYGQACQIDKILAIAKRHRLFVVEDCAQAHGTKYQGRKAGTFGEFGCFSFYPTKNLGAYGDGGLVATSDDELAREVRLLRVHGAVKKYQHEKVGINSRLDELQAAILNVKLKQLDRWLEMRRAKAHRYNQLFKEMHLREIHCPYENPDGYHTYHLYVVRAVRRDLLLQHLTEAGIQAAVYYPSPLHLEKAFAFLGYQPGDYPEAEKSSAETMALPLYPELTDEEQIYVVDKIKEFYGK